MERLACADPSQIDAFVRMRRMRRRRTMMPHCYVYSLSILIVIDFYSLTLPDIAFGVAAIVTVNDFDWIGDCYLPCVDSNGDDANDRAIVTVTVNESASDDRDFDHDCCDCDSDFDCGCGSVNEFGLEGRDVNRRSEIERRVLTTMRMPF